MIDLSRKRHSNYDHYKLDMLRRLDGFYGRVDARMNKRIAHWVVGKKVLDIGCGFGSSVEYLRVNGFDSIGVDMLEDFIEAGKRKYPFADLRAVAFNRFLFPEKHFDTVILKDTLHHILEEADIEEFWESVRHVCKSRVIIMDPNPTFLLRLARRLIKHVDPICTPFQAKLSLESAGFSVIHLDYHEILAFPLSGGFVGSPLVHKNWGDWILTLDQSLENFFKFFHWSEYYCWRYLIVADVVQW